MYRNKLKKVEIISVEPNDNPKFIKTQKIVARRDGNEFIWEMAKTHDSVHVLVDNVDSGELLLVAQVRIPVLVNDPSMGGVVVEACAGLVDKEKSLYEIVQEEIEEELGYKVPITSIDYIRTVKSGVGRSGGNCHLYYARVTHTQRVSDGGGLDGEDIAVVRIPYGEVQDFMFAKDTVTDTTTLFLLSNWLNS